MIELRGADIIDMKTGEVLGNTTPKFSNWKYNDYAREFDDTKEIRFLEPMTAQELDSEVLKGYLAVKQVVAEEKFDGHRALNFLTSKGNRLFSRRVSKETGWFSENTDQTPHIRDLIIPKELYGTVLDNEGLLPIEGCSCRSMQSVMGALPETAINNQLKSGFAYLNCFDILYYCGVNVQAMPYWKRKLYEFKVIKMINSPYIKFADLYATKEIMNTVSELWANHKAYDPEILEHIHLVKNYEDLCVEFIKQKKEGLILKDIHARYEQKRSKSFIKMKAHRTYDCVIMGYEDPSHYYEGKALSDLSLTHDWWEDAEDDSRIVNETLTVDVAEEQGLLPVTKFYAMDWIGAIKFGVWKDGVLVEVGQTSGLTEEMRKEVSENKDKYLGKVLEVEAQHIINKETGSLQHPRFVCFREDKSSEMCCFNDHIRKYGEDE